MKQKYKNTFSDTNIQFSFDHLNCLNLHPVFEAFIKLPKEASPFMLNDNSDTLEFGEFLASTVARLPDNGRKGKGEWNTGVRYVPISVQRKICCLQTLFLYSYCYFNKKISGFYLYFPPSSSVIGDLVGKAKSLEGRGGGGDYISKKPN